MAWIEFHAAKIKRLQKFRDFRVELAWSVNEALGCLGNLWGEIIELREDGDIAGWQPEYVAELVGAKTPPDKLWAALTAPGRWIDVKADGKVLVHDWLNYAGRYLESRYQTSDPARLVAIWEAHGLVYKLSKSQQEKATKDSRKLKMILRSSKDAPPDRTGPYRTEPNQHTTAVDSRENNLTATDPPNRPVLVAPGIIIGSTMTRAEADEERRLLQLRWQVRGDYRGLAVLDLDVGYCEWALQTLTDIGDEYKRALKARIRLKQEERGR